MNRISNVPCHGSTVPMLNRIPLEANRAALTRPIHGGCETRSAAESVNATSRPMSVHLREGRRQDEPDGPCDAIDQAAEQPDVHWREPRSEVRRPEPDRARVHSEQEQSNGGATDD